MGLQDYDFEQEHRKASEAYLAAQQTGLEIPRILYYLDQAAFHGKRCFAMATSVIQRAGEYNFLQAVHGLRLIVELGINANVDLGVLTRDSVDWKE